ncbi:MAG: AMP-binding protein [Pseudomonadota bacterium]
MTETRHEYQEFYDAFQASDLQDLLSGSLTDGVNACVECCDRHPDDAIAIRWRDGDGGAGTVTYGVLRDQSARFANLLAEHGVGPGDRVAALLPRRAELVAVVLGVFRAGAVYQPLFTAFGPKAIEQRLEGSGAKLVVTDPSNRSKLDDIAKPPLIATIDASVEGDIDFAAALDAQSPDFDPVLRHGDDTFLMMFTSGTTGAPKGVNVPLAALPSFEAYMRYGIELLPEDRYWNIADPGWAYGLFYAVIGPLLLGATTTLIDAPFTVESTCDVIRELEITNLAGAPTAYRMLIAAGGVVPQAIRGRLRVASSAGEPLNPEVMRWFEDQLECPLRDHYGQTEVAMVLNNHHGLQQDVRPGSAGKPMPGYALAVVDEAGNPVPDGQQGILAVDRMKSSLFYFAGYAGREGQDWVGDYYLTGDSVEKNEDGTFSFVGRSDDMITSAGYRIGPFDVESCLIEHDAVMESAVVGKPDAERGHIVKAFVVLNDGHDASDALSEDLRLHVRNRLGGHAYPREIEFAEALPKTPSGKIQRFLLREG